MLNGIPLFVAFIVAVVVMIAAIGKFRIHPFLSIMGVATLFALLSLDLDRVVDAIGEGFSGTFKNIGLVIIFGALIGAVLERTGAALKMSDCVVKAVGTKRPEVAMTLMGWVVSIPVFCDSGFVILDPVRKALVKRVGSSSVSATVALAIGLYVSHCFIPPTPGPIAAAGALGVDNNLLLVMGFGVLVSIPALFVGCLFAKFVGKRVRDADERAGSSEETAKTYEELLASYGRLPSAVASFAPILVPIVLMGLASACAMLHANVPVVAFLGKPIVALAVGFVSSLFLLRSSGKGSELSKLIDDSLKTVGPILFITAAGGVLGKVVGESPLIPFITERSSSFATLGVFFPFLLSAALKTAQGSSTVALVTTANIVAPMLGELGLDSPTKAALTVIAIGAGAMTVSHANDSYFWVVSNFGKLTPTDGYKTQTTATALVGLTSIATVWLVSLFL